MSDLVRDDPRVHLCSDCGAAIAEYDLGPGPLTLVPGDVLVDLVELLLAARPYLGPVQQVDVSEFFAFFARSSDERLQELLHRVARRDPAAAEALVLEWVGALVDETDTGVTGEVA